MESGIQSSFIPHDASKPTTMPRIANREGGGLAELGLLVSIVLLVASAALAGAVFLYSEYAHTSASSKVAQLQRAKDAFEPSLIAQITRLDDRMLAASSLLAAHTAPVAIFDALQAATLSTVSFTQLSYTGFDPQNMKIKMQGVAQSVNSIALQADLFSKNGVVIDPIFSDITRQADGVHFTLSAAINPAAINYTHVFTTTNAQVAAPAAATVSPFGTSPQTQTQTQTQTQVQPPVTPGASPGTTTSAQ